MNSKKFFGKKADLSLSINAIVILILAITILGLGLTFVRGLFKQAESKITEVTSASEISNPPTRDNPLTLSPSQIQVRNKDKAKVVLAFLNNADSIKNCKLSILAADSSTPITIKDIAADVIYDKNKIKDLVIYNSNEISPEVDKINVWTLAADGSKVIAPDDPAQAPLTYNIKKKGTGTFVLTASMCCLPVEISGTRTVRDTDVTRCSYDSGKTEGVFQYTRDLIITVTS